MAMPSLGIARSVYFCLRIKNIIKRFLDRVFTSLVNPRANT